MNDVLTDWITARLADGLANLRRAAASEHSSTAAISACE